MTDFFPVLIKEPFHRAGHFFGWNYEGFAGVGVDRAVVKYLLGAGLGLKVILSSGGVFVMAAEELKSFVGRNYFVKNVGRHSQVFVFPLSQFEKVVS